MNHTLKSRQRGITLIETLIALVVTAIGLFGILGLQMHTLADTQGSVRRTQAIHLIEDLAERLQSNPDALGNLAAFTEEPNSAPTECASAPCAPSDLASYSVKQWRDSVAQSLPGGQAQVFIPKGGSRQLGVLIGWRESKYSGGGEPDSAEKEKLAKPFEIKAAAAGGGDVQCPAGLMCHLQYLQPVQRCTPQALSGGALYCPS